MQVVRILRAQISDSAATLNKVRSEAAESRGRLNGYSEDQQKRLETLRGKNRTIVGENQLLKSELEKAQTTVNVTSENLARAEKRIFELEAEERFRKAEEQKQQTEVQQRADSEATVAEPVTNDEELRDNPDAVLATRGKQDARPTDAVLDQDASNIESAAGEA